LRNWNLRLPNGRRASREKNKKPRGQRYAGPLAVASISATLLGSLPCPVIIFLELVLWIEHWIRHA